jgi:hypothetical protein
MVSIKPQRLYPRGRSPRFSLERRLGGPQSRSGRRGEVKIHYPTGAQTLTRWSSCPLDRKLGGPQSLSGRRGTVKIIDPTGLELRTLCRPVRSKLLYRLSYRGSVHTRIHCICTFSCIKNEPCICLVLWYWVIFLYFNIGGWSPYCVHSALRPLLAYCTCPG